MGEGQEISWQAAYDAIYNPVAGDPFGEVLSEPPHLPVQCGDWQWGLLDAKPSIASLNLDRHGLAPAGISSPFAYQGHEAELLIPRRPALSRPIRYACLDRN
jgi:hypothetical protein